MQKNHLINKGNKQEYCNKKHMYDKGDQVQFQNKWKTKSNQNVYLGLYVITVIRNNGTGRDHKGEGTDTFSICSIVPYSEEMLVSVG